jgi:hypothetical protein
MDSQADYPNCPTNALSRIDIPEQREDPDSLPRRPTRKKRPCWGAKSDAGNTRHNWSLLTELRNLAHKCRKQGFGVLSPSSEAASIAFMRRGFRMKNAAPK